MRIAKRAVDPKVGLNVRRDVVIAWLGCGQADGGIELIPIP